MISVKTIFKTLIGTVVIIVCSALVIELLNISTTSFQLIQMTKLACKQSAVLFSQETYKEREADSLSGGSVNLDNVVNTDGGEYVSGNFYGEGVTPVEIYNNIYSSDEFKEWIDSAIVEKGNWKSVDLINKAINSPGSLVTSYPSGGSEADLQKYIDSMLALSYKESMMTPLNMGVPYLDENIINKMFKWNLAQLASNCNPETIRQDSNNEYCIFYNGFRIYADQAKITNISYKVYDITDSSEKAEFESLTNIDTDNLGYDDSLIDYLGGYENDDERKRICVVGLEYSIPVAYEGITPIKNIFEFVWNTEVGGLDGNGGHTATGGTWNDSAVDFESGGFENSTVPGVLPVPGKLIYYVVR